MVYITLVRPPFMKPHQLATHHRLSANHEIALQADSSKGEKANQEDAVGAQTCHWKMPSGAQPRPLDDEKRHLDGTSHDALLAEREEEKAALTGRAARRRR